jgi:hypothetical protein
VTDQQRGFGTAFVDEPLDVGSQPVGLVGRDFGRSRGQVVAAHVGCDDAESRRRERFNLLPPAVPELGEPVQQEDQRSIARLDVMQSYVADLGVAITKFAWFVQRHHPLREVCPPSLPANRPLQPANTQAGKVRQGVGGISSRSRPGCHRGHEPG